MASNQGFEPQLPYSTVPMNGHPYGAQAPGVSPAPGGSGSRRPPHTYTTGQVIAFVLIVAVLVAAVAGLIGSNAAREAAQKEYAQREAELTQQIEQLEQERDELQALYDQAVASGAGNAGASAGTSGGPTIEIDVDETVASAKAKLQEAIDSAKAWLDSDAGQSMQTHVRLALQNAIDIASRLIEESGIADPQTYIDAADMITGIIDEETAENAQEMQEGQRQ